jgi:RimJ/RimL family protein N-acetyltransferase
MSRFRINHPDDGGRIARSAGLIYNVAADQCIARLDDDGALMGGVVYQNYTRKSIGIHMAGFHPRWVNRDMIWMAFDYPFNQLGVDVVFGQLPASNTTALDLDRRLGFEEVLRVPDVYPCGEAVLMRMYRENCKWLKAKGGSNGR